MCLLCLSPFPIDEGDLLTKFTKEKLQDTLGIIRMLIVKDMQTKPEKVKFEVRCSR